MTPLRVLIVDDEAPARRKLLRLLAAEPAIEIAGQAASAADALHAILTLRPGLLFLDIQLPDGTGFDVLNALPDPSSVPTIFVTAFDQFALKAFEVHALDYLLKPIDPARFSSVLARARRLASAPHPGLAALLAEPPRPFPQRLLLHLGDRSLFVPASSIEYLEAARNYVTVHAAAHSHTIRSTLDRFSSQLDPRHFVRINRSQIVNLNHVRELQPWFHGEYRVVLHSGLALHWSRRFSPGRAPALALP